MNAGIIILAAGSSSRMGQSKQLLKWQDSTLLQHAVDTAFNSDAETVVVVLGANEEEHRKAVKSGAAKVISNPRWRTGMGSSLKEGLKSIAEKPGVDSVIVMVCDQPYVTAEHLKELWVKFNQSKAKAVASAYAGTYGVPALFSPALYDSVLALADDQGAKTILQQLQPTEVKSITLKNGEKDLDTYEDYQKYKPGYFTK
jgi:molybdenum cofactor cytidylyltransferase